MTNWARYFYMRTYHSHIYVKNTWHIIYNIYIIFVFRSFAVFYIRLFSYSLTISLHILDTSSLSNRFCTYFFQSVYCLFSDLMVSFSEHIFSVLIDKIRGTCVAQLVKWPTWAQVMILWFVSLSPSSGSVLTAQSLVFASDSLSPSLSALPLITLCLSKKIF